MSGGLAGEVAVERGPGAAGLAGDVVERGLGDADPGDAGDGAVEESRGGAVEGDRVGLSGSADQRFLQQSALLGSHVRNPRVPDFETVSRPTSHRQCVKCHNELRGRSRHGHVCGEALPAGWQGFTCPRSAGGPGLNPSGGGPSRRGTDL